MAVPSSHILHELSKPEPAFLSRLRGGDLRGAIDEFMEIAFPYLVAYPPDPLRGAPLAERHDLAMEVILHLVGSDAAAERLRRYEGRPRTPFAAYLRRVARNLAIDRKRRERRTVGEEELAHRPHPDPDPERRRRDQEEREARVQRVARRARELMEALADPECRRLLIWRLRDRLSFREIAAIRRREETASTVGKRFYVCRDRLRRELESAEGIDLGDFLDFDSAE